MTEAVEAVTGWALAEATMHRVWAHVDMHNLERSDSPRAMPDLSVEPRPLILRVSCDTAVGYQQHDRNA